MRLLSFLILTTFSINYSQAAEDPRIAPYIAYSNLELVATPLTKSNIVWDLRDLLSRGKLQCKMDEKQLVTCNVQNTSANILYAKVSNDDLKVTYAKLSCASPQLDFSFLNANTLDTTGMGWDVIGSYEEKILKEKDLHYKNLAKNRNCVLSCKNPDQSSKKYDCNSRFDGPIGNLSGQINTNTAAYIPTIPEMRNILSIYELFSKDVKIKNGIQSPYGDLSCNPKGTELRCQFHFEEAALLAEAKPAVDKKTGACNYGINLFFRVPSGDISYDQLLKWINEKLLKKEKIWTYKCD